MSLPVGIVLAAGSSSRFGSDKRQYRLPSGHTILEQAIDHALQALPAVVVALGPADADLQQQLLERGEPRLHCMKAASAPLGMGSTLAAAVAENPSDAGWVVLLGDMPFIRPETIAAVAAGLQQAPIVQPVYCGRPGHPVGFSGRFSSALQSLQGDQGARSVIDENPGAVLLLSVADPGIHQDIDTVENLPRV